MGELSSANSFELTLEQKSAWLQQIEILQEALDTNESGHIFFEYTIPRMGKRCDVVLIVRDLVLVIECKMGATKFHSADIRQTVDYALDLKNFHFESHERKIIPVLLASSAQGPTTPKIQFAEDGISSVILCSNESLKTALEVIFTALSSNPPINPIDWANSQYKPTPTIIEAAQSLYRDHGVSAISSSGADAQNLELTASFVDQVIADAKQNQKKAICFITGVPGAGKTLAGLNIATTRTKIHEDEHAVFLSGNGPLVAVLQKALSNDERNRLGVTVEEANRKTKTFIQNIHHFRDHYLSEEGQPTEKVAIFDEAQRAWTKAKASRFMKEKKGIPDFAQSEPEFLLNVMDRHTGWCVIVALIGGGQEINDGEAGMPEWFDALRKIGDRWITYFSPNLDSDDYTRGTKLEEILPQGAVSNNALHLGVSMRSFRAERVSEFVNLLISNRSESASEILRLHLEKYPVFLTRSLHTAREWVNSKKRGNERTGIAASAGARRLIPEGIHMKANIEPEHWFLNSPEDVRSSNHLELAASQFDIQGLELDWAIVCWDADLRHNGEEWEYFGFKGSKWNRVNSSERQLYLRNAYRVLLTRARQGMIIFIPLGNSEDVTRPPKFYKDTYSYLVSCGVPEI